MCNVHFVLCNMKSNPLAMNIYIIGSILCVFCINNNDFQLTLKDIVLYTNKIFFYIELISFFFLIHYTLVYQYDNKVFVT